MKSPSPIIEPNSKEQCISSMCNPCTILIPSSPRTSILLSTRAHPKGPLKIGPNYIPAKIRKIEETVNLQACTNPVQRSLATIKLAKISSLGNCPLSVENYRRLQNTTSEEERQQEFQAKVSTLSNRSCH